MYTTRTINEITEKYRLRPDKKLGQNFLVDTDIIDRVVKSAGKLDEVNVLEVGPGIGALTNALLLSNAVCIYAVEIDKRCVAILKEKFKGHNERLKVIEADALYLSEEELIPAPIKIIANLPYHLGTEFVLKWLSKINIFQSITIILQKEVVDRMIAPHSTGAYGRLSVTCQLICELEKICDIDPQCFYPAPRVVSSAVIFRPKALQPQKAIMGEVEKITRLLFARRRKALRGALKGEMEGYREILDELKIDPMLRPENLSPSDYYRLAEARLSRAEHSIKK